MPEKKVRVLIVDDSALIRQMFQEMLSSDPGIEVIGTANDPYMAREKIKQLNPDVITLDVEMPKMDGISFLQKIMTLRPMPVVMASTLTQKGADITLQALEIGAVDYVSKPAADLRRDTIALLRDELVAKVKMAACAKVASHSDSHPKGHEQHNLHKPVFTGDPAKSLIAIGSSTGGVEALRDTLKQMPEHTPPIIITQHMPEVFTRSFAARLDRISAIRVCEAEHKQRILPSHVYIAPGNRHLQIQQKAGQLYCILDDGPNVSGHKPSVDVMFASVAQVMGAKAVAAILTGMGKDGANGLLQIRKAGGHTLAEHEQTCVVYGMPKAAVELGAAEKIVPLPQVAYELLAACNTRK